MTGPDLTALPPTVRDLGMQARRAARVLRSLDTARKRAALLEIARELQAHAAGILAANARDMKAAQAQDLPPAMLARLHLTPAGLDALIRDVQAIANLPDPVGERTSVQTQPSGIRVSQLRVPLGVLGVIYESRPNVTVDVAALALMSGNAVILRGGKESVHTNTALKDAIRSALRSCGLPDAAVQVIRDPDRSRVRELLRLDDLVDVIIPRGGAGLHRFCVENATVPVIVGGIGVVHLYLDGSFTRDPADVQRAAHLIVNAKVQKPSACNALDTLLLDRDALPALPTIARALVAEGVELRADPESLAVLLAAGIPAEAATEADYGQEFLALTVSLCTVAGLDEALEFIAAHGNHTDVILTRDDAQARRFVQDVDSAAVMVNASPRFNDGAQLGLGAEVAISTQKLHARGPMGLRELTTLKWVVEGDGHLRA